jgi:hypothetical protein
MTMTVATALGAWLRLDQFTTQVLIDDEWHAVHQVIHHLPATMFLDFGFADYSIPLGILDWYMAQWFGLSETAMRLPMLACGLATLVVLPLYVARTLPRGTVALFALLLAISPLLVIYSRMARPYAISLLLGWLAHAAFQRYWTVERGRSGSATVYALASALATWLHPIIAPFVMAPLLWALWQLRPVAQAPRHRLLRLFALTVATGALTAALVLPPLIANAHSMSAKSGIDSPNLATIAGAWYAWLGTPSTAVVILCLVLAAIGTRPVWRALPEARTGVLGIVLTFAALLVTRPMFSYHPISLARYLLPFVPLLLLALAAGTSRLATALVTRPAQAAGEPRRGAFEGETRQMAIRHPAPARSIAGLALYLLPLVALAWPSPLWPMLRHPNTETLHFVYHFDFRPAHNPYLPYMARIPLSPFWSTLSARSPGTVRIAAAPFHFESFNWDAPRWERISRQTVLPGYLSGLCVDSRPGETPLASAFRFRNAVHLASQAELERQRIDYVVWQKPYAQTVDGEPQTIGADTAACDAAIRARFGAPAYEDAALVAFRLSAHR